MRPRYPKRFSSSREIRRDYMDNTTYQDKGKPYGDAHPDVYLNTKALKNLPYSSYSIKADPYDASLPTSRPYPVLNAFNRAVGGSYGGEQNIDGGNAIQYANSLRSKMLAYFDIANLTISVNYRYRPMRLNSLPSSVGPDPDYLGSGLVDQCRQTIAEGTSVLQSTTFTQMAIYNYVIETDLPMGKAVRTSQTFSVGDEDPAEHYLYNELSDVIYAATTFYQLFIQDLLGVINNHNSYRLKMGTMIRNSWNRETPNLNNLFGLFKKKSFLSLMDSLCLSLPGEYVDVEWAKQMNSLTTMLSRRSDAFTDPCLELQAHHVHPTVFRMYAVDANGNVVTDDAGKAIPIFDLSRDLVKTITAGSEPVTKSYYDAINSLTDLLSAYSTTVWARNHQNDIYEANGTAYFNEVKENIDVISLCVNSFKTLFNDVREVLDVVSRTGIVTWQKGFRPSVIASTDAPLFDNRLVSDIFKTIVSGDEVVSYNDVTKRWITDSIWNMYHGVPEYDIMSGGAFITFSAKTIDLESDTDHTFVYLPILCYYDETVISQEDSGVRVRVVARDGVQAYIKAESVQLSSDPTTCRLVPLPSQNGINFRVPRAYSNSELDDAHCSVLTKLNLQVFGMSFTCEPTFTSESICVDSDILAVYTVEIQDITNDAIAYARSTSPFKGATGYEGKLGFDTFGSSNKMIEK